MAYDNNKKIGVGATANDRKGDSLRTAFQKVNNNFEELYTALGLAGDNTLSIGAFEFTGSTITTTDSTPITIDQATTITSDLTVGGDIVPSTNLGSSLGSPSRQFKSLYVSTNTIYINNVPLSLDSSNNILVNNAPISSSIEYTSIPNAPSDIADLTDNDGLLGSSSDSLTNGSYSFTINNDGSIDLPTLTNLGYEPFYDLNGPTLRLGVPTSQTIITGPVPNSDNPSAQRLVIQGQKGYGGEEGVGEGGDVYIWGGVGGEGASGGDGGDIKVRGGAGQNGGGGGYVKVEGGDSQISGDGNGGYVEITGGNSYYGGNGNGGNISVRAGTGNGTGTNGRIEFYTNGFNNQWQFNTDATTKFPNDTLETRPDARLYIDAHDIGEDYAWVAIRNWNDNTEEVNSQVTVRTDGVGISTTGGSVDWSFNPDGSLTVPPSGIIGAPDNTGGTGGYIQFFGAGGEGGDDNTSTTSGNIDIVAGVDSGEENDNIYGELDIGNIRLKTRAYTGQPVNEWKFGWDGNLTLPASGDILDSTGTSVLGGTTGSIRFDGTWIKNVDTGNIFISPQDGNTFLDMPSDSQASSSSVRLGNVDATGSVRIQAGDAGKYWDFKHNGITRFPSNTIKTAGSLVVQSLTGVPSGITQLVSQVPGWDWNGGSNLATTGGSGTGLTVNVGDVGSGYTNLGAIVIHTAGTGYVDGDVITVTSGPLNPGSFDAESSAVFVIRVPNSTWTFAADGVITTNDAFTIETPSTTLILSNWEGGGGWNQGSYIDLATTGGTGTGLTVDVAAGGGGYINIGTISINNPGSGYLAGDVITINNENNLPGTFTLAAVPNTWEFGTDGSLTFPDNTVQTTAYTKVIDSWTVATGTNTYSITVPLNGTYQIWVRGNIPNGIITYTATVLVTNNNVPALGTQYAWNYTGGGSPLLLTAIPDQIRGTAGAISTDATYVGTTGNRFDFTIANTSGSAQTVNWGYTILS